MPNTPGEFNPDDPVARELFRIFGDGTDPTKGFVLLPIVDPKDALRFLLTVPKGISFETLERLAAEYRAANPLTSERGEG